MFELQSKYVDFERELNYERETLTYILETKKKLELLFGQEIPNLQLYVEFRSDRVSTNGRIVIGVDDCFELRKLATESLAKSEERTVNEIVRIKKEIENLRKI